MQLQMNNETEAIGRQALPPAPEDMNIPEQPRQRSGRHYAMQSFACIFCAAAALFVLFICALDKIDEIRDRGLLEYLSEEILKPGGDSKSLGDLMSVAAFGHSDLQADTDAEKPDIPVQAVPILPRIFYIPKEQIADEIYLEKEELERKIFELYSFDYSKVPSNKYAIIPTDLSAAQETELKNDTAFNINMAEISKQAKLLEPITPGADPLVLIVHTHGTESFSEEGSIYYDEQYNQPRSENTSENIVAVGRVLASELNARGIPTLHCEIMHDKESYIHAYERSAESIARYLEEYPSIQYVFDVHRDSVIRNDLSKLRPVTLYKGTPCAQIMMIVGSSEKGAGEYNWESNLILAEAIQQRLFSDTLGIPRKLYLRGASYNQQLAKHGLLLEIGSCGNYLSEAQNAAKAFAKAFADILFGKS